MSIESDVETRADARAHRRWLIGISITLLFGTFGAVMALLAYTNTLKPDAPARRSGTSTPARPGALTPRGGSAATPAPTTPAPTTSAPVATPPSESPSNHGKGRGHE